MQDLGPNWYLGQSLILFTFESEVLRVLFSVQGRHNLSLDGFKHFSAAKPWKGMHF